MRKKEIILPILIALLLPIFVMVGLWGLPSKYEDTFLGELKYKKQRLHGTEGNKIVFVGGSSLVFGIDSRQVAKYFPEYEVVNFGMYAALGTTVMYDLSVEDMEEGDILILTPEQDAQTLSNYFDAKLMWQAADGAPELLRCLNGDFAGQMLAAAPYFAAGKWKMEMEGTELKPDGIYSRSYFNEYGDLQDTPALENVMVSGWDANQPISFSEDVLSEEFVEKTVNYIHKLEERGVRVYYYFPPMNRMAMQDSEDGTRVIQEYGEYLTGALHCDLLGNPANALMDPEWFYDTNFHLNESGKPVYTIQFVRDLKAVLGDSSPTEDLQVTKPKMKIKQVVRGNDEDEAYFLYEQREDVWWIIGITEEGKKRKELVIPTMHEGSNVECIVAGALDGATKVEMITVQGNISFLPDDLLADCTQLKRLVLEELAPDQIHVGTNLLPSGSKVSIVVEPEYVNDYKTDYSWGLYRSRIVE